MPEGPSGGRTLQRLQRDLRVELVRLHNRTRTSHLGSCLSVLDILLVLLFRIVRAGPSCSKDSRRDTLILSKGHAAPALYLALASKGVLSQRIIDSYGTDGSVLAEHPVRFPAPGLEVSTGSLGHGLPIGVGIAFAARAAGQDSHVFVVMSDGECQEGSVWEGVMAAARLQLNNLTVVVDWNGLQGYDYTEEIQSFESVEGRFRASGWRVAIVDGHDLVALEAALAPGRTVSNSLAPTAIFARTVKGKGVTSIEGKLEWHYKSPSNDDVETFIEEISRTYPGDG